MTNPLDLPILLTPRFDPKPWGGRRLERFGFRLPSGGPFGEAVITVGDAVIADGALAGATLQSVVSRDPERVIGWRGLTITGGRALFPVLIKIIDASDNLSIQVHPDDHVAATRNLGKTEAHHVIERIPGALMALGLRADVRLEAFAAACHAGQPTANLLRWVPARPGESILVHAGTIHALGAGCVIFEAQQPSEITYRLDDWGRVGIDGMPRPLHLGEGLAVCDPTSRPVPATPLSLRSSSGRRHLLSACRYFALERIALTRGEDIEATTSGSPQTLTVFRGGMRARTMAGEVTLDSGQTAIVTAAVERVRLSATAPTVVLRTWVPDLVTEVVAPALAAGHDPRQVAELVFFSSSSPVGISNYIRVATPSAGEPDRSFGIEHQR